MRQVAFFLCVFLLPAIAFAYPDNPSYLVKNYTDVDGLPQNSIKAITVGKEGFAWLTTEDGLVRFDGHHFENATHSFNLLSHRFGAIIPGNGNDQFITATDKGQYIRIYNGRVSIDTSFVREEKAQLSFLPHIGNYSLSSGSGLPRKGNGFIVYNDTGVIRCSPHLVYVFDRQSVSAFRNKRLIYRTPFQSTTRDRFFIIGEQLFYFNEDLTVTSFSPSGTGTLKINGDLDNATVDRGEQKKVRLFWNINDTSGVLFYYDRRFYSISVEADRSMRSECVSGNFDAEKSEIISAYFDKSRQVLLLGSYIKGLFVITRSLFTIRIPTGAHEDKVFYAQMALPDSSLLTSQGYLFKKDQPIPEMVFDPASARSDKYSLVMDEQGNTWTKIENTLYCSAPGNFRKVIQRKLPHFVSQLYRGLNGRLWIGLDSGELYTLDTRDPALIAKPFAQLPSPITCFVQLDANTLLLGAVDGLFRLQLANKQLDSIAGTTGKYIRSLYQASADELWITTYGHGFYLYQNKQLKSFPNDRNNYLLTAHCMLRDKKDFFWISTNKGLFQVARADLLSYANGQLPEVYYRYYSTTDGLLTNEFNGGCQPCGVQMADGRFSFPTIDGLVWFDPEEERMIGKDEPIFIDKIWIDNKEQDMNADFSLSRNLQQMKVFLSVPYWGNLLNIHLYYALVKKGEDPAWLPVENNVITLSTVPAGDYTLLIGKITGFGRTDEITRAITFHVPAPWILRPVVLMSLAVLLTALIYLFIQMRTRIIRQRNILLEKRIRTKTAELQQALDELAQSQQELLHQTEWQQKMIAVFSHDIKAPMKYLVMTAERITKGLTEENNSSFIGASSIVHEHIRRLYHVMDNILQYIKTQITETVIQEQDVDLYELVQEKVNIYVELARQMNTSLHNNVPAQLTVRSNRVLLSVILHNLIDNAVKVTERGRIAITATYIDDKATIIITDTGIGMQPALIDWINQEDKPGRHQGPAGYKEMGIGLLMVKDLAALLRIKMHAASSVGETSIAISWDVRQDEVS